MAAQKGKAGGGSLTRSEVVTIRLTPRLRYLVEIAARSQRRTVSNYIECAIESSLKGVRLAGGDGILDGPTMTLAQQADRLWNVHESSRFLYLALLFPWLLVHREQLLWQLIKDRGLTTGLELDGSEFNIGDDWVHLFDYQKIEDYVLPQLKEHWDAFNKVVDGELPEDSLPDWKDSA